MSDEQSYFEDRFARQLRSYAAAGAPVIERAAVARAVAAGVASRRSARAALPWPWRSTPRLGLPAQRPAGGRITLAQLGLVGVLVLAIAIGFAIWAGHSNQVVSPGPSPSASAAPTRSLPPTPTDAGKGWPGGLRQEPSGAPVVVGTAAADPEGDAGLPEDAFVDIVAVLEGHLVQRVEFQLAEALPSLLPNPITERRIGYGVVIDIDDDGVADLRVGTENAVSSAGDLPWNMWIVDLRTGATTSCRCDLTDLGGLAFETWYPYNAFGPQTDVTLGLPYSSMTDANYYVWASIAEGNSVLATDFAPDSGWLELGDPNAVPERANSDRPGPLRPEPIGGASVVAPDADPAGDPQPKALDLVDIVGVAFQEGCWRSMTTEACVFFDLAEAVPRPLPNPHEQWLAFGLIVDTTGDGVGDMRYGVDNAGNGRTQIWRTDLATGITEAERIGMGEGAFMDAVYPGQNFDNPSQASVFVVRNALLPFRFYVWASAIDADGNESTDFAPDLGWHELQAEP